MAKHFLSEEDFEYVYSRVPKLTVEVVVKTAKGLVLTERNHSSWQGLWHFPGATVGYREAIDDALRRLVKDELGISCDTFSFLRYVEWFSEEEMRGFGYSVSLVFVAKSDDVLPEVNEDGEEVGVFSERPEKMVEEHKSIFDEVV